MRFDALLLDSRLATRHPRSRYYSAFRAGVLSCVMLVASITLGWADAPMRFGVDAESTSKAISLGLPMSYGSLWVGAWNYKVKYGWWGIETQLRAAKSAGVTPVVQWWYWGDDISPACVENGCTDRYEGVWKDKATWNRMSNELADLIVKVLGPGSGALVVIETEFNKGGIQNYEPFDGYLVDQAKIFHDRQLSVILGLGNWGYSNWRTFDRAAAASDMVGVMVLQSSVHEASTYLTGADMLISAAQRVQTMFHKPSFVTDFAFSSYPEPSYEYQQDTIVKTIFHRMDELKAAGVRGMIWRMLSDDPNFDTRNYHGMAERYWGLLRADGSRKLAFTAFLNGMLAEMSTPAATSTPTLAAPANLVASASGSTVTLTWTAPASGGPAQAYTIEAGSSPGLANLANFTTGSPATTFSTTGVAPGSYYVRVRATNGGVTSAPSNETLLVVR